MRRSGFHTKHRDTLKPARQMGDLTDERTTRTTGLDLKSPALPKVVQQMSNSIDARRRAADTAAGLDDIALAARAEQRRGFTAFVRALLFFVVYLTMNSIHQSISEVRC